MSVGIGTPTPRPGGTLLAVLLNPPSSTRGTRTTGAVARAADVLGYDAVTTLNLCAEPTRSVVEINDVPGEAWVRAREGLSRGITVADAVLAAWGVSGMVGTARLARERQVAWLHEQADRAGLSSLWMVGGEPRHPSRWHQYLSDKYGRTAGGSFEERLAQALVATPIRPLVASSVSAARMST